MSENYQEVLDQIISTLEKKDEKGEVSHYLPRLSNVDPNKFGIYLLTTSRKAFSYGDYDEKFSIQSIAKVLSLTLAFKINGDKVWERVGVEPSGSAFNSLVQLEFEKGIPRNPFINAGAIVVCDILAASLENPKQELLAFIREMSGNPSLEYCQETAELERQLGQRNHALAHLMKDFGNIHNDLDCVLDIYFSLCSIEMTCKELSQTFLYLASNGKNPFTNEQIISSSETKRINAIMQLCGFYDEAGEFSFRVGLPGKSGIGGGIIAVHPERYSIAVWSPRLNKKGNSYKGMKILEEITTKTQSSIF